MAKMEEAPKLSLQDQLYKWIDSFHNKEPERHPSRTGFCLTVLMIPVVLVYTVVWFVDHQSKPPTEILVIEWSVAYGPYPMKVKCHEASCWLYLSGCSSEHSAQCLALTAGQEMELQFCWSPGAREGLHVWWSGTSNSSGLEIHSQARTMWMSQKLEAGRSSVTYVKTEDRTQEESSWERLRREWFTMYLSSEVLDPEHSGCQAHRAGASSAQIVMRPEFYDKTLAREDFFVSFIGEVGGAYGIISTIFFGLYILLWNLEYGYNHGEEVVQSAKESASTLAVRDVEAPAVTEKPQQLVAEVKSAESDDDLQMEPRKEAQV